MSSTAYIDVENYLQTIEEELDPENAEAIREFVDYCAAQGLTEVRQQRSAQSLRTVINKFAPDDFRLEGASESELKQLIAGLHRSDYADSTKHTIKSVVKKFYKVENGGHEQPDKTKFFTVRTGKDTTVTREDLFKDDELKRLFGSVQRTRDRAMLMVLYETAARPAELLSLNVADFTSNGKGDFIHLQGSKDTPNRTNQLVRTGRTMREWLAQHPFGGELGGINDPSAPMWVKTEQQSCIHCGDAPYSHEDTCDYEPDRSDRLSYAGFYYRFKKACEKAGIPENKTRPYNLRHTRLTEVATFMGYEQLNKFAGWVPGSSRAKVYVHLNNDDVNKAIREEYSLTNGEDEQEQVECPFCNTVNQARHSECRQCGRAMSLKQQANHEEKLSVLERLIELDEKGVLDKLEQFENKEAVA